MIPLQAQIGNNLGVAARDTTSAIMAEISADGSNTVTVSAADARKFQPGMLIDIITKSSGAAVASARSVDAINIVTGVITYSGANVDATPGTDAIYAASGYEAAPTYRDGYTNLNGGFGVRRGLDLDNTDTVDAMRARLAAINATTYSADQLDKMTYNDMVYAIRVNDAPGSI